MVGHGVGNWKILYGGLLYIGYTLFTVYASYNALYSLEAFKILGRKTANRHVEQGVPNNAVKAAAQEMQGPKKYQRNSNSQRDFDGVAP